MRGILGFLNPREITEVIRLKLLSSESGKQKIKAFNFGSKFSIFGFSNQTCN